MRSSTSRPRWRRARPHTIRLISRSDAVDLVRALDQLESGSGPWVRHRLQHGTIRGHLVIDLPPWLEVDELAMVLVGLEDLALEPILAVVGLGRSWILIEARAGTDPVSRSAHDIDQILRASGMPAGVATMPLREMDAPGTIVSTLGCAGRS